jgi:hypothetical protein
VLLRRERAVVGGRDGNKFFALFSALRAIAIEKGPSKPEKVQSSFHKHLISYFAELFAGIEMLFQPFYVK